MSAPNPIDAIRRTSAQVDAMAKDWPMIDALMIGTSAMRAGGKLWLPQWPSEDQDSYKARLHAATLHPVFKRTVTVNAARPFSRPIVLDEATSAKVLEWTQNIDLQGSTLAAFSVRMMSACLAKGLGGVLVDYPKAEGIVTRADEKAAGVRPYCAQYSANAILGWKTVKGENGLTLSQLRLLEKVDIDDGEYGLKAIEQVRLLEPGKWALWRQVDGRPSEWYEFESGKTTLDFIPFVFFYGLRTDFGCGVSPLMDLAYQNVEHWQSSSDQQTILHVARVPILFAMNFGEGEIAIGAGVAAKANGEKVDLKYVEHSGAAIESGSKSILDLQDRMRATGAELISLQPALMTATQVSSDSEATKSLLQQITENFEESLTECLNYMAAWVGDERTAEVTLYKDFGITSNADSQSLTAAAKAGAVSKQTLFEELQRRDVLSADRDWEEEAKRLKAEEPAEPDGDEGDNPASS